MTNSSEMQAEIVARIEHEGIKTVRLLMPDLHGVARAKQVTATYFAGIMLKGHSWATPLLSVDLLQDFDQSRPIGMDNGLLVPDLGTFAVLPWRPSTAHVVCDFVKNGDYGSTPRQALRKVESAARAMGFQPTLGNELEFYVYQAGDSEFTSTVGMREWYSDQALGKLAPFMDDLYTYLPAIGVGIYEIFNEHGGGQLEANVFPGAPMASVDQIFVMKAAIKEIALAHGLRATFMAKPSNSEETTTSGYHLHQTLLDLNGNNTFVDDRDEQQLSVIGMQYLAGQLAHAPALTATAAQTITAYKRFRAETYAPVSANWRLEDRGSLVRVIIAGRNTRIENRLGASDANPYLLVASQLAAGLDGIERSMTAPPPEAIGTPSSADILPANLTDATRALSADLVLREALGAELVDEYCAMLHNVSRRFQDWVTDWEIREYREVL